MTLPAHRFEDRKKTGNDVKGPPYTFVVDYDETITNAPAQLARIATGLKALGDTIIVLTGNESPAKELEGKLEGYGFPFDALVQYDDSGSNGIARAEHLKQFGAWCGIDNRIDRCFVYATVCPHLYLITEPTQDEKDEAKGTKKVAKKDAKKAAKEAQRGFPRERLQRGEWPEARGAAPPPPNLRVSDSGEGEQPEHECGTCVMWDEGLCWGYGNFPTDGEWVCDAWSPDPDWQAQDAAEDAAEIDST